MSEDENRAGLDRECKYQIDNPAYYMHEKIRFGMIAGMRITGAIWSRWDAFICLEASSGERYVLHVFHNSDTGEPDFHIYGEDTGLLCFSVPECWDAEEFRHYMERVGDEIREFKRRVEERRKERKA